MEIYKVKYRYTNFQHRILLVAFERYTRDLNTFSRDSLMTESLFIYRSRTQRHCTHANNTKHKTNSIGRWHKENEQAGHKRYRKFIKPRTTTRRKAGESEASLRLAVSQSISNPCLTLCNPFSWSQKLEEFASGQWIHSFRPEHEWVWKKERKGAYKKGSGIGWK